jgi:hypothetical protein
MSTARRNQGAHLATVRGRLKRFLLLLLVAFALAVLARIHLLEVLVCDLLLLGGALLFARRRIFVIVFASSTLRASFHNNTA